MNENESEFGRGLTYCLGLFLAHAEREVNVEVYKKIFKEEAENEAAMIWFSGASDHLYDLQIPKTLPEELQKRLNELQEKAIEWGHGYKSKCALSDVKWAIQEAKSLLFEIDKSHGIDVAKGLE